MKKTANTIIKIFLRNWFTLLWFEIPYRIIGVSLCYPLVQILMSKALAAIGIPYISQENIGLIFSSPYTIFLAVCILLLLSYYICFEAAALIVYCEKGWGGEHLSIFGLWKSAFLRSLRFFHYKNLPIYLLSLPFVSLSLFRTVSSKLMEFRVPEFIMEFILENKVLSLCFAAALVGINLLMFFYIFTLPSLVLNGETLVQAWKSNRHFLKGKKIKTGLRLIFCALFCVIFFLLAGAVGILLLAAYAKLFFSGDQSLYMFRFEYNSWRNIGLVILNIIAAVVSWAIIVVLFHQFRDEVPAVPTPHAKASLPQKILKGTAALLCAFVLLTMYSETEFSGLLTIPQDSRTRIIAHRAGAVFAPENTLAALDRAIEDGADMAEIDVQQTRDKALFILHDSNFKRTAGVDLNVWDADASAVKKLTSKGEPIPTLDDMLSQADKRIDLMIELKSTGHETNLEQQTIDLIAEHQMENQCIIASMDLGILKRANEIAPSIRTAYISAVLLADQYDLSYVDGYSVETTSLSPQMVAMAHLQNKKVYAWTANSKQTIQKILHIQADGLITDNPALASYYVDAKGKSLLLDSLTEIFYG